MTCVVSIHRIGGEFAGAGFVVAENLILTCAHVVNIALKRPEWEKGRPNKAAVEVRFAGAPSTMIRATVDEHADAWSKPPAEDAEGADLCVLKLQEPLPAGVSIGRLDRDRFSKFSNPFGATARGY
jgi:hypothetical protein